MSSTEKPRRGRWRRVGKWLVIAVVVSVVALPASIVVGLRIGAVRQLILARVAEVVEVRTGVSLRARDFRLGLTSGAFEVVDLELSVSEADSPFLVVPRVRGVVRWRTLLGEVPVVESLAIENPRLDLRATLPSFDDDSDQRDVTDAGPSFPSFELRELALTDGEVIGPPAPESMDVWLDTWQADGIRVRGSVRSGTIRIDEISTRLTAESARRAPVELRARLAASGDANTGAFAVDSLEIRGSGLTFDGHGAVEASTWESRLAFDLKAEPAILFPDLTPSGRLNGTGDLTIERNPELTLGGTVKIDATDVPGDLAQPWVGVEGGGFLDVTGTSVDALLALDLNIALTAGEDARTRDKVLGTAEAIWRRGAERLLTASVDSLDDSEGVNLSFAGQLTPAAPGRRRASGELRAPSFLDVLDGTLRAVQVDLFEPDAAEAAARFGLDPRAVPEWWPRGSVTASLVADGPVATPRMSLDARWDHEDGESLAVVAARTLDGPSLRLQYQASVLPEMNGQRTISGKLIAPDWPRIAEAEIRNGRLKLDLQHLGDADDELARRLPGLLPQGVVPDTVPDRLLSGALSVRGEVSGPLKTPDIDLEADWTPAAAESVHLVASGSPSYEYPFLAPGSSVALTVDNLGLSRFDPTEPPQLAGSVDAAVRIDTSTTGLAASLRLEGHELAYGEIASFDRLAVEATSDGETIELRELSGTLTAGTPTLPVHGTFSGDGHSDVAWPPDHAKARLSIANPVRGVDRIEALVRVEDGVLHIDGIEIESPGNVASLRGSLPFGKPTTAAAAGSMTLTLSDLDLTTLTRLFAEGEDEAFQLQGRLDASVTFDPADPVSAVGSLVVSGIAVAMDDDVPLALDQEIRIEMSDGRVVVPTTHLRPSGGLIRGTVPLNLAATVNLARGWRPGDDLAALVDDVFLELDGAVDAKLLNPFLAGGVANGEVNLDVSAKGILETLTADIVVWGPDARVLYRHPYPTRLEDLDVHIVVRRGEVKLQHASARLNGGTAEMTGTVTATDGLRANLKFDDARYRLQFGITTLLRGDLQLDWPVEGRQRIGGTVVIERAVLRRNIRLTRDVLGMLFDVRPESGGEFPLDTIDLDLTVLTDQGILIKNNVADLQADWGRIEIGGTAAAPLFDGRVDLQPGGIITAFGQALRIDEASFEWSGQPVTEPRMIFETTSSADDPSILKSWRNEFFTPADMGPGRGGTLDFWGQGQAQQQGGGWEQLATGAMTQATSTGRAQLTYEPLPLFGETDTQARYTLATDLAPQLSFIASTNPRETEAQTYILDVHQVPGFKSFRAQVFTNDQKNAGITIQQTLKLGKKLTIDTKDPFLRSTTIDVTEGIKKRRVRRAIEFRKSDPFPQGAGLDVEVDVMDLLQRKGFPSAAVQVDVEPRENNRVDLVVTVEPGAQVRFVFEGEQLSSGFRRAIAARYRPSDLGEKIALEDVQREAVMTLRGQGFLEPRVDVEAIPAEVTAPDQPAIVRVVTDGGRQVELTELVIEGVPEEDASYLAGLFATTLSRVRLAVETPASDAALLRALDRGGFPDARITGRKISEDGLVLVVDVDPGQRRHLASVEIVGLDEEDRARFAEALGVQVGDPARQDRIGSAGRFIEQDLRDRGHAEARVIPRVRPVAEDRPYEIELRYEVDPGPSYEIQEVRIEGLKASRPKWVKKTIGLEAGQVYRRRDVAEARARLFRTGVFRRIQTSSDTVSPEPGDVEKRVTFEVEESRRWQLAYGGRWEEGRGVAVVADLLNRHSFGVGHMTGIRGILGADQRSIRLYHVIPRIVGEKSSLELLVEAKREPLTDNIDVQGPEAWAQVTFPLTERIHNRPYIRFSNPTLIEETPDPDNPPDNRVVSPLIGYQVAFDSMNRRIGEDRRRGVFVGVDFLGSHERLGSDVTTLGVVSQLKYFWPLGKPGSGRFTWAQFWRGGVTEAEDGPVPLVDRFRVGGEFSVRGYPTNSLGPLDENGDALGGEVLFVVNQEIHAQILRTENLGTVAALAFFDAGNVWLDRESLGGGLFKSVGVGARYLSPVGPLRLDIGVPLDRRPDDPTYKIYFGFGSVF